MGIKCWSDMRLYDHVFAKQISVATVLVMVYFILQKLDPEKKSKFLPMRDVPSLTNGGRIACSVLVYGAEQSFASL